MLLSELQLIEASVTNSAISRLGDSYGGEVTFEYGDLNFEAGGTLLSNPNLSVIIVHASPFADRYGPDKSTKVFSLKIDMKMVYTYPKDKTVDETFLIENTWYFSSFMKTYFKFFADTLLAQAGVSGISLPMN